MVIGEIVVRLTPHYTFDRSHELRIEVKAFSKSYVSTIVIRDNDLESRLDFYMDRAKEALRASMSADEVAK